MLNYDIIRNNDSENRNRHEILLLKNEIQSMKNDNNWLWLKHTGYNVLFIIGVSTYILSSIDIEGLRDEIKNVYWSLVNQSIYVIDGKILILGNNS